MTIKGRFFLENFQAKIQLHFTYTVLGPNDTLGRPGAAKKVIP